MRLSLATTALLLAAAAPAQWAPVFSTPNNEIITVLSSPRDSTVWFITNFNRLYRTSDAGSTWTVVPPGVPAFIPSMLFAVNDTLAFKTGGQVWRTTDGGTSWTAVYTATGAQVPTLWMVDAANGVLADSGVLYRTADGGGTWAANAITQPPSVVAAPNAKGNLCVRGSQLWVALQSGGVAHSPDLGSTWDVPANTGWGFGSNPRIDLDGNGMGMVVLHNNPFVYITTDGGQHWSSSDNSLGANEDVVTTGTGCWYIPNPADHFYIKYSADSGATWTQQLVDADGFEVLERSRAGHYLWAGTETGTVYRYDDAIALGVPAGTPAVRVGPVPCADQLFVQRTAATRFRILTSTGQLALSGTMTDGCITTAGLASGIYVLVLERADGLPLGRARFVKR